MLQIFGHHREWDVRGMLNFKFIPEVKLLHKSMFILADSDPIVKLAHKVSLSIEISCRWDSSHFVMVESKRTLLNPF